MNQKLRHSQTRTKQAEYMKNHRDNPADKVLLYLLTELRFEKTMRGIKRQSSTDAERYLRRVGD